MKNQYIEDTSIQGRKEEIQIKLVRIYQMLNSNGMDALLLSKHPNFSWITAGGKSFVANCFDNGAVSILITKMGCYAICNVIEEPRLLEEENLPELGFGLFVYGWEDNKLFEFIKSLGLDMQKVISDSPCGNANVRPELINPLRYCLTENEIARYRYLGDTMSMAFEEYMSTVKPGMTEYEIAGGISNALWKYNIEQVMHLVSTDERNNKFRHALPTSKKLEHSLIASINGRYKGLVTTTSRMIYFGKPSDEFVKRYIECCEMECMTIAKAKIGADEIEMYHTLKQAYIDRGYPTMFAKHGQGGCQGYWPRDYMITPKSHHIIQKNQAYCYNPVIDGVKTEDSFITTEEGPLFITRPISYPKITCTYDGITMERPGLLVVD